MDTVEQTQILLSCNVGSIRVFEEATKKWNISAQEGSLGLYAGEYIRIEWSKGNEQKCWGLLGGILRSKGQSGWILRAYGVTNRHQETIAIRFSTRASAKCFAQQYNNLFSPLQKVRKRRKRKHRKLNYAEIGSDGDDSANKTKLETRKCSKTILRAMPSEITQISNPDAFVCGYYRELLLFNEDRNDFNIIPSDITLTIFKYQQNIKYIKIDFSRSHRIFCCSHYHRCNLLRNNRGEYLVERDAENVFYDYAIKIVTKYGMTVGVIPNDYAMCLAPLLDQNKIDLKCIGGSKQASCREIIEIIQLKPLKDCELKSFEHILEKTPFDVNRLLWSYLTSYEGIGRSC